MFRESRFFNIRQGEHLPLIMAALGTFSSIASVVFGRTLSDAVLLSARPAINVANFFIFSSLALMAVSLVYFQLLRIVSATKLNISLLLLSALGVPIFHLIGLETQSAVFAYAIFLITAPALGNIIVWNAIGDAFNARQGRRLFHLVSAASTLGGIASGCLIPGLVHFLGITALPVADATSFILMAVPVFVLRKYRRSEKTQFSSTSEAKRSIKEDCIYAVRDIVGSPLLKNLSAIFFLTALATNIIDFVLKYYLQTSLDKEGIAIFYGHFNAISNSFNLLVQLTLLSQFLTRFKTRTLFSLTPIILLIFSMPFVFVYSAICVIALRFMDVALRFTIQDSAREIAISSLPRLLRNRSKVVFKGVMNPLGGITAGLMLNLLAPLMGAHYTPLLLIPVNLITLYFVRDLNRYSASHLYNQLKTGGAATEGTALLNPDASSDRNAQVIAYDPKHLLDYSPSLREATLDGILLDNPKDLQAHSDIRRYALALIAHETRLAQATLCLIQLINENDDSHALAAYALDIDTEQQKADQPKDTKLSDNSTHTRRTDADLSQRSSLEDQTKLESAAQTENENTTNFNKTSKNADIPHTAQPNELSETDRQDELNENDRHADQPETNESSARSPESASSQPLAHHNPLAKSLQDVYDKAFYRMFKGLMALYRRDLIQTIFQSLAASRASTRAQAIELLQLTLTNCPYAKRILILCDDFNTEEKVIRLDDMESIPPDDALAILKTEDDRSLAKLTAKLTELLPNLELKDDA
ncbi:MAG: hypothetical protein IJ165_02700 [Proteobacteria bacterium]|nr:hypothetical protein [Pseudomonadota bacterium]